MVSFDRVDNACVENCSFDHWGQMTFSDIGSCWEGVTCNFLFFCVATVALMGGGQSQRAEVTEEQLWHEGIQNILTVIFV